MPAADLPPDANGGSPGRAPLALSKKIFSLAVATALLVLLVLAFRRSSAELFSRLSSASPRLVALGFLLNVLAFASRALRLNLLLPRGEELPFGRAWSVSGATSFLLQVMPFRSGEVGAWAALRAVLGATWARSAALFAIAKLLDTATVLLAGVAGGAWLLLERGTPVLGAGAAAACVAGAGLLLVLPAVSGRLVAWLVPRLPEGGRRRAIAAEALEGLAVARRSPRRYLGAALASFGFLALHLAALYATARGLGLPLHPATLAVALLASVTAGALIPSPAGTFGPYESGFAAAATLDGLPLATGAVLGGLLHLLATLAAGAVGLAFFLGRLRDNRHSD
ncbi:MAG TPA: lysylphosphatidylglycerol synthase transmembrane domain-containing protein [Thermoanaerobaculia bacterium]|nr:lysylphosphatidylglycerol synthase transmembrane domain-containing protein [Thermoanaerobaculia bacterium]